MSRIDRFVDAARNYPGAIWRLIWGSLDVGFRRMCVMSSLHAQLTSCTEDECIKMDRLNTKLHLVDDITAMRFPTLFGPKIWKGVKPLNNMETINDRYFERLVRLTPCWLLYTDTQSFIKDLKIMVSYCVDEYKLPLDV